MSHANRRDRFCDPNEPRPPIQSRSTLNRITNIFNSFITDKRISLCTVDYLQCWRSRCLNSFTTVSPSHCNLATCNALSAVNMPKSALPFRIRWPHSILSWTRTQVTSLLPRCNCGHSPSKWGGVHIRYTVFHAISFIGMQRRSWLNVFSELSDWLICIIKRIMEVPWWECIKWAH